MRAYVCRMTEQGRAGLAFGVTGEYKTLRGLFRAARTIMETHDVISAVAEVFYDWDNRYGKADKSFVLHKA